MSNLGEKLKKNTTDQDPLKNRGQLFCQKIIENLNKRLWKIKILQPSALVQKVVVIGCTLRSQELCPPADHMCELIRVRSKAALGETV
jgi:hypothetical protein